MARIRSAVFVDFDNIFSGLLKVQREAAVTFAERPEVFLDAWRRNGPDGQARSVLVCRAYLNPKGSIKDEELGSAQGWLHLSKFHPNFVRAGFEVVDCPALTAGQKNAADIRIVIDVLDVVDGPAPLDEITIMSSDSDFTPLLYRLRRHDIRTTIVTAAPTALAYEAVADTCVPSQDLIDLLIEPNAIADADATLIELAGFTSSDASGFDGAPHADTASVGRAAEATKFVLDAINEAEGPVNLASLSQALRRLFPGDDPKETRYFGHGGFSHFVRSCDANLQLDTHYVWDPRRHEPPSAWQSEDPDMPEVVARVCSATKMPRLDSARWIGLFEELATYASVVEEFKLNEAILVVRDRLKERGLPVGRQSIAYVITACAYVSVRLDADPPPKAEEIREAFLDTTVERANSAGLDLDEESIGILESWLGHAGEPAGEIAAR